MYKCKYKNKVSEVKNVSLNDKPVFPYGEKSEELAGKLEEIAQDLEPINMLNKTLNKYLIQIDYYPRIKHKNNWILNVVYLPIY